MPQVNQAMVTELPHVAGTLQQNLAGLHETLSRIGHQNKDAALQPLIAESLSRCAMLRQHLDRLNTTQTGPEQIVDAQVFQRLMALAGPATALELLDQLVIDLDAAREAVAAATPVQDWPTVRSQCHVLIAVAGSIGAHHVQTNAEQLHRAATASDATAATALAATLIHRLQALLAYVQHEQQARQAPS